MNEPVPPQYREPCSNLSIQYHEPVDSAHASARAHARGSTATPTQETSTIVAAPTRCAREVCDKPLPPGRRRFCSDRCSSRFREGTWRGRARVPSDLERPAPINSLPEAESAIDEHERAMRDAAFQRADAAYVAELQRLRAAGEKPEFVFGVPTAAIVAVVFAERATPLGNGWYDEIRGPNPRKDA